MLEESLEESLEELLEESLLEGDLMGQLGCIQSAGEITKRRVQRLQRERGWITGACIAKPGANGGLKTLGDSYSLNICPKTSKSLRSNPP